MNCEGEDEEEESEGREGVKYVGCCYKKRVDR
jgi:hypothetical protein